LFILIVHLVFTLNIRVTSSQTTLALQARFRLVVPRHGQERIMPVSFRVEEDSPSSSSEGDENPDESFTEAEEAAMRSLTRQRSFQRRSVVLRRGPVAASPIVTASQAPFEHAEAVSERHGSTEDTRRMLMDAQASSTYFRGFTEHMPVLCEALSVSPFDADETILQEGEEGTWLGVLLKGSWARSTQGHGWLGRVQHPPPEDESPAGPQLSL